MGISGGKTISTASTSVSFSFTFCLRSAVAEGRLALSSLLALLSRFLREFSVTFTATARHTAPICLSSVRTPASRVYLLTVMTLIKHVLRYFSHTNVFTYT